MPKYTAQLRHLVTRFNRNEDGIVAILFAFSALVLFLIVSGAIEISRRGHSQTELQHSLDSAALAGRLKYEAEIQAGQPVGVAKAAAEQAAQEMFKQNIAQSKNFETMPVMVVQWNKDAMKVSSDADMQILTGDFMPANIKRVGASAQSEMSSGVSFEIALMLDNSTSMKNMDGRPQSRMTLLRAAAVEFTHDLFDYAKNAKGLADPVRMSVVPWGVSVNVKTEAPGPKDPSGVKAPTAVGDAGSGKPVNNPNNRTFEVGLDGSVFSQRNAWAGCLRATNDSRTDYSDAMPSNGWKTLGIRPSQYSDPNASCPKAMVGLTGNRKQVLDTIERMTFAEGGTHADVGLRWGLRTLSPNNGWPAFFGSGSAAPYKAPGTKKIAVLITDGKNEQATWVPGMWGCSDPYEPSCTGAPPASELNTMMLGLCKSMRDDYGITIYTIALNMTDTAAVDYLKTCAGDPARAFSVDSSKVGEALRAIGRDAMKLRLTM